MKSSLEEIAKIIRKRLRSDFDLVICITGEEGVGKSTLALHLGKLLDNEFTLERNILFSPKEGDIAYKLKNLPKYSCIILDEAIKVLYKLNWASTLQITLNKVYALARKENQCTILCIPRFTDLNKNFRTWRVKMWIHILARGKAVMFLPDQSPFADDIWYLNENQSLLDKKLSWKPFINRSPEDYLNIYQTKGFKTFACWFEYLDMPKEIKEEYVKLCNAVKYEGLEFGGEKISQQTSERIRRLKALTQFALKQGITHKQLADATGIPRETITAYVNG